MEITKYGYKSNVDVANMPRYNDFYSVRIRLKNRCFTANLVCPSFSIMKSSSIIKLENTGKC